MKIRSLAIIFTICLVFFTGARAEEPAVTIFEQVRIFDGKKATLSGPSYVLVRGNIIEQITNTPIPVTKQANSRVINGGGNVSAESPSGSFRGEKNVNPSHLEGNSFFLKPYKRGNC